MLSKSVLLEKGTRWGSYLALTLFYLCLVALVIMLYFIIKGGG